MPKRDSAKRHDAQPGEALEPGRFAYEELDRVLHERARLGILTSLVAQPNGVSFNDLKRLCSLTDGNLNRHLAVLAEAGLITIDKLQGEGRGQTIVRLTTSGRRRFLAYVAALESVIADAMTAQQAAMSAATATRGWSPA